MTAAESPSGRGAADIRSLQRRLAALLPAGHVPPTVAGGVEPLFASAEPARLVRATPLEGSALRAHRIAGEPEVAFAGFLNGTQASETFDFVDGIPVVYARTAAVIRVRRNRRLVTWGRPLIRDALYAPRPELSPAYWQALERLEVPLVNTSDGAEASAESQHPFALRDAAIGRVQRDRQELELRLAERWCALETGMLFVDGGIGGSERVAVSDRAVGVVKSHRTLYADGSDLRRIFELGPAERSSVFRVTSPHRVPVASWYLRVRDRTGRDPLWGLVRVEVAQPTPGAAPLERRADEVSRWLLAETKPLTLPDPRWDKLMYGVRDCETFLKAVI